MSSGWEAPGMRSHAWNKLRADLLLTNTLHNKGMCQARTAVCTGKATEVHHVLGIRHTGHDPRYLQCVCRACNLHIGDPLAGPDPVVIPKKHWS